MVSLTGILASVRLRSPFCVALPFLLAPLFFPLIQAMAAGPPLEWAKLVPNVCGSSADTIAEDGDGNIYLGSGPNTALTKFDSAGNLLWSWGRQETDCAAHIWVRSVSIDEANNIYVSGGV